MGQVCIEIVQAYQVRDEILRAWAGAKGDGKNVLVDVHGWLEGDYRL